MNVRIGLNSRLDTIQAAILIEKLAIFGDEIEKRNLVAKRYADGLTGWRDVHPCSDCWRTVDVGNDDEVNDCDGPAAHLKRENVPTAVYYPIQHTSRKSTRCTRQALVGFPYPKRRLARLL